MQRTLEDFYHAVRAAGVPVPPSGSIAASRAAALVGYGEREVLKFALSMNLANSQHEQELVEDCFDDFFRFEVFGPTEAAVGGEEAANDGPEAAPEARPSRPDGEATPDYQGDLPLAQMLMQRDRSALARAMQEAARDAGLTDIWFFTQKSLYTQQIPWGLRCKR